MGKIKSKMVKHSAERLLNEGVKFEDNFERNKQILGNNTMPSKKLRNRIAGYLARLKKQEKKKQKMLSVK